MENENIPHSKTDSGVADASEVYFVASNDRVRRAPQGPFSKAQIKAALESGEIQPGMTILQPGKNPMPVFGLTTSGPATLPSIADFLELRRTFSSTILCGPNNCGKSFVLKGLKRKLGVAACYLGCSRFFQVESLGTYTGVKGQDINGWHQNFIVQTAGPSNSEVNAFDLNNVLLRMRDEDRASLFTLCGEALGAKFSMRPSDPENVCSPKVIEVDGVQLRTVSTGTRLIMTLFAACLDRSFNVLLIDEPEIGISPASQSTIVKYLFNKELRNKWFPDMRQVFVATHSHLFLNREIIADNFSVTRASDGIHITQIQSIAQLHRLQFNLLGNQLETLFLPAAVLLIEGPSDYAVLSRALELRFSEKRITLINARTESEMGKRMHDFSEFMGGMKSSPYRGRLFVLLDRVHSTGHRGTKEKLVAQGVLPENITVLSQNGIEHYYPREIMQSIFRCDATALANLSLQDDWVSVGSESKRKVELAIEVAAKLDRNSKFGAELEGVFDQIQRSTGN